MLRKAMHSNGIMMIQFLLNLLLLIDGEENEAFMVVRDGVALVLIGGGVFEHFVLPSLILMPLLL